MEDIPYEEETVPYTSEAIHLQKRRLIKDALNYGLKLKAIDETLKFQSDTKRIDNKNSRDLLKS
jgi:hypothetical protein